MDIIAVKYECDRCHRIIKGIEPVAFTHAGETICAKCQEQTSGSARWGISKYVTPTEAVSKTLTPKTLDPAPETAEQ